MSLLKPLTRLDVMLKPKELVPRTQPLDLEGARRRYLKLLNPNRLVCDRCGSMVGVELESARTAYVKTCPYETTSKCLAGLDGLPCLQSHASREECPSWPKTDPNADVPLCRDCAKLHHEYWDEQWAELDRGRM